MSLKTVIAPYLTYIKIGAAIALLGAVAAAGFHFGGLSADDKLANYKTEVQSQYATNLKTVADTLNKQIQDGITARAALQKVVDQYELEKSLPPATAGVVERLRLIESASCAAGRDLPKAGTLAGGPQAASGIPASLPELDRLHQAAFDAADRDAKRLNTVVKLAP